MKDASGAEVSGISSKLLVVVLFHNILVQRISFTSLGP